MNPTHPLTNLALSFSGGGYRATAYNLGVLSYLNHIEFNQQPLIKQMVMLSTVSGGTITGVKYALCLVQGKSFKQFYKELYGFLEKDSLINEAFAMLNSNEKWEFKKKQKNLINAFSVIYQNQLLGDANFDVLIDYAKQNNLQFMFNATDLENALPFRFQTDGDFGNGKHSIPEELKRKIKLGDIVAASSCFPMAFEPLHFPDDFLEEDLQDYIKVPLRIMDGGLVDNQGIESIWLAEIRKAKKGFYLGTFISSDVAQKNDDVIFQKDKNDENDGVIKPLITTNKKNSYLGQLTIKEINIIAILVFILSLLFLFIFKEKICLVITSLFLVLSSLTLLLYFLVQKQVVSIIEFLMKKESPEFLNDLKLLNRVPIKDLFSYLMVRIKSFSTINLEVFLKRIRQLHYDNTHDDKNWSFRFAANLIYSLKEETDEEKDKKIKKKVKKVISTKVRKTSDLLQASIQEANKMDTTLWLPDASKKDNKMLNDLIVCGQATICFNLKFYLEGRLKNLKFPLEDAEKPAILDVIKLLEADFKRFNESPDWLLKNKYAN
jgi:predicted acylesterase/phospholipase RssA